jgi:hypothetical protein
LPIIHLVHRQRQDTRFVVQALHERGIVAFLRENLDVGV